MLLLRSLLFVPGVRPDRFAKAMASGADAVIFDLEDSVDASRKSEGRRAIAEFFAAPRGAGAGPARFVRVNAAVSAWFAEDLALVAALGADAVVLPKVERAEDVTAAAMTRGERAIVPLIETPRGVLNAESIAGAHPRTPAVLFGAEDLTAAMGIARTIDGEELVYARSRVALAAAAAGVDAIDAVFIDLDHAADLRRDAGRARALGFRGKMAIHPSQVPVINEVFSPTPDELERARRIVAAFDASQAAGEAVFRLDGRMVDAPVVLRARRILDSRL
jgi:citrate lyase subunit beta/citryl-CoA lyase